MQRTYSPSVRRRRLAAELRRARDLSGLTGLRAAKELGWPHSKLTKIESAKQGVKAADLEALMDLYKVGDRDTREAMLRLARESKERGWWWKYRDIFGERALPDFEAEASGIRCWQAQLVPGLLQTPDYIEAVFRAGNAQDDAVVQRHVQGRIERQHILNGVHPPRFAAILDEGALRRQIGGREVLHEQLQHLCNMATRHNIDLRVLPFVAGEHQASNGSFTVLDFPNPLDVPVAFTETVTASMFVEEPAEIATYNDVWSNLQGAALTQARSAEFIQKVMRDLT
ncbi:transcriptional regulator with XRE-family HTH domain [Nocardiopsis mwathae]|uniref:Transcriptional regulator with XRE-family HTH domain n=1 Tax=Nocardiopsis mwathae TaxID=1472723 RepID=A0A7W9YDL8_9ACTN|nr:helix-turn-helix transcriptional regulator [Nocardiopsis mwathae]MBB6170228.1 transcriptional regulator with XRE-family HTH domain [Nocardiopsis mwathae]